MARIAHVCVHYTYHVLCRFPSMYNMTCIPQDKRYVELLRHADPGDRRRKVETVAGIICVGWDEKVLDVVPLLHVSQ